MKKVLIVDDDEAFKTTLKGALDPAKYEATLAGDGVEALEAMERSKPDIILLDIKMPRMDGLEFLNKINEKYGAGKTPILITSNMSSVDTISEGIALGVRGYVLKSNESLQGIIAAMERLF